MRVLAYWLRLDQSPAAATVRIVRDLRHRYCGWAAGAALAFLVGAPPAAADELELSNGDRITGQVMALTNGMLAFQTPNGQLNVPWISVISLAVTEPLFVSVGTRPPAPATITRTHIYGRVTLRPGGIVSLTEITGITRSQPPANLDGRLNAGLVNSDGNTEVNTLRLDGEVVGRTIGHRYTGRTTVNRSHDREEYLAHNWTTSFRYDRFLTRRLFLNGNTIWSNDRLRDLDLRAAAGGGLGYQVVDTPRARVTTDAGVGFVNEAFRVAENDVRYFALQESAQLDIFFTGNTRFVFFHRHDGYFSLTGEDNRFLKMGNGIRVPITRGFIATIQLDMDYDPTPVPGRRSVDRTFALTFGYQFSRLR
jgi:putative salt-induced outer membrane protein YdiY